jgi:hypothetical protein
MDDMISRSALIAELEAFKMSLGDIVLRFVVDRVIDVVKNFQVKEVQLDAVQNHTTERRECCTCKHEAKPSCTLPCYDCLRVCVYPYWESKR